MLSIFLYYGISFATLATNLPNTGKPIGSAYCIETIDVLAHAAPLIVTCSSLVIYGSRVSAYILSPIKYKVLLYVINQFKIDTYNCIGPTMSLWQLTHCNKYIAMSMNHTPRSTSA